MSLLTVSRYNRDRATIARRLKQIELEHNIKFCTPGEDIGILSTWLLVATLICSAVLGAYSVLSAWL